MSYKINALEIFPVEKKKTLGDFYWAYADILRGIGIPESTYDQRVLAMMSVKLLIDNHKLLFNFEYKKQFGLSDELFERYKGEDTKTTFKNILADLENLGQNMRYFSQDAMYNPGEKENILAYLNHAKFFALDAYMEELPNEYLEMVLDIYTYKADFTNYPKEQYKDLYEITISRMAELKGDLTGQHFTQKSIIHLMCEAALHRMKDNQHIAIYDPTCGTGSMIMEAAHYFKNHIKGATIEVFGQEYHPQVWLLCKIFLEISSLEGSDEQGIPNIVAFGNTLTNPKFSEAINGEDSFDFIIANPPFGVDWKHDVDKVLENMKLGGKSHFMVVKDGKDIVTPKKSDGQYLFIQHIIRLMEREKARGKQALAAVISSSTLISTGSKTGAESKIRHKIFNMGLLKAVIEQPEDMFSNTSIASHIWFFDTEIKNSDYIKVVNTHNSEQPLFCPHPKANKKMKNAYSAENIKAILQYLNQADETLFVSKNIATKDCFAININAAVGRRIIEENVDIADLEKQINDLIVEMYMSLTEDQKTNAAYVR
jgi:type I restriction enzyme M protein